MNDLKKTFAAGFVVLMILLLTPYYLQIIGYQETPATVDAGAPLSSAAPSSFVVENKKVDFIDDTGLGNSQRLYMKEEGAPNQTIQIESSLYRAALSTVGGGSLEHYALVPDGSNKYIGGYTNEGVYEDSVEVSLILNQKNYCAPCVGVVYNQEAFVLASPFVLKTAGGLNNGQVQFLSEKDSLILEMQYEDSRLVITKTTTFFGDSFASHHKINATDKGGGLEQLYLIWDKGLRNTERNLYDDVATYSAAYISHNKETEDLWFNPSSMKDEISPISFSGEAIEWAAIRTKYFITALVPASSHSANIDGAPYLLNTEEVVPSYSASVFTANKSLEATLYVGPLDIDHIGKLNTSLDRIMNFGWFVIQPFSRSVLWLLKKMHAFGLNYGIILILFALLVRVLTGPLTKKSFVSSQNMQAVQPKLKKIQEKHKNNSQKLNQEMVKLYREEGVNPLGGCLPMLLQMPLLFSLFLVFRSTIEFRGAPFFGWISNLSQPDTIIHLPVYIPIYGDQIAFLPILLGISMFLTQKMAMASMDAQQKPMMYIMSAFFFLIFNSFPSGLNLYYLVYNLLNYLQQKSLKKA